MMMRLSPEQRRALEFALEDVRGEVYLYGSRVNDQARGGDVDILVLTDADPYPLSKEIRRRYWHLCDEKIDVAVMNPRALSEEDSVFLNSIARIRLR